MNYNLIRCHSLITECHFSVLVEPVIGGPKKSNIKSQVPIYYPRSDFDHTPHGPLARGA